jgi:hypothetical protein
MSMPTNNVIIIKDKLIYKIYHVLYIHSWKLIAQLCCMYTCTFVKYIFVCILMIWGNGNVRMREKEDDFLNICILHY